MQRQGDVDKSQINIYNNCIFLSQQRTNTLKSAEGKTQKAQICRMLYAEYIHGL